jgi:hypothetical protein
LIIDQALAAKLLATRCCRRHRGCLVTMSKQRPGGRARLSAMPAMTESRHHRRMARSKMRKYMGMRSIADRKASMTGLGRVLNSELILLCYFLDLLRSRSCFFRHWFEPQRSSRNRRGAVHCHCMDEHAHGSSDPRSCQEDELIEVGGCTPRPPRQSSDGGLKCAQSCTI